MAYAAILDRVSEGHTYEAGFNGKLTRYRWGAILETLPSDTTQIRVLEIGGGEGALSMPLAETGCDFTVIEPAGRFFEVLSSRLRPFDNARVERVMLEDFEADPFDLIVAGGVLEHVEQPDVFLERVRRLLSPGGRFALTVPNAESLHRRVGLRMGLLGRIDELGPLDRRVGHFRYYTFDTLRRDLVTNGFRVESERGLVLKPLPNGEMDRLTQDYCDALHAIGGDHPRMCAEIFAVATSDAAA